MQTYIYKCILSLLLISLFNFTNGACPTNSKPSKVEDCTAHSTSTNFCCMLSSPGYKPTNTLCKELSLSEYTNQNIYPYEGGFYNIDCGNPEFNPVKGNACGNQNPVKQNDCWYFSTMDSSCCFHQPNNTQASCKWLGSKDIGVVELDDDVKMYCASGYIRLGVMVIIGAVIMMF